MTEGLAEAVTSTATCLSGMGNLGSGEEAEVLHVCLYLEAGIKQTWPPALLSPGDHTV